jgi:hypothetical protein
MKIDRTKCDSYQQGTFFVGTLSGIDVTCWLWKASSIQATSEHCIYNSQLLSLWKDDTDTTTRAVGNQYLPSYTSIFLFILAVGHTHIRYGIGTVGVHINSKMENINRKIK